MSTSIQKMESKVAQREKWRLAKRDYRARLREASGLPPVVPRVAMTAEEKRSRRRIAAAAKRNAVKHAALVARRVATLKAFKAARLLNKQRDELAKAYELVKGYDLSSPIKSLLKVVYNDSISGDDVIRYYTLSPNGRANLMKELEEARLRGLWEYRGEDISSWEIGRAHV